MRGWRDLGLFARHVWQRTTLLVKRHREAPKSKVDALAETIAALDMAEARRMAIASWPALASLPRSEEGSGKHACGLLALVVTEDGIKFVATGPVVAGKDTPCRILLVNAASSPTTIAGKLDMVLTEPRGAAVGSESMRLGEAPWMPLMPPKQPGLYPLRFSVTLDSGARLEARGLLTVVAE